MSEKVWSILLIEDFVTQQANPIRGRREFCLSKAELQQKLYRMGSPPGWDNNGKPGKQVATKSLPTLKIFGRNPAIITIYVNFIY